jgi:homoserine O-acetyltransferase
VDLGEFTFEDGGVIKNLRMSYVTHGKLNAAKDNAILSCTGSANHHQIDHLLAGSRSTPRYFISADELHPQTISNIRPARPTAD